MRGTRKEGTNAEERRESTIERVVHRIEERIEEWRKRDAALQAEAEANRYALLAEAVERERLLVEALGRGESDRGSVEEVSREQRVVFVLHSEEAAEALKDFAREGDRLTKIVPRAPARTPASAACRAPGWSSRPRKRERRRRRYASERVSDR